MIDIIARGMIEESNGDISQISEKVNNHTEDSDIHVTTTDKENWNSHPNDVQAEGNPVTLDGLQGGVPFSEMVVSGKNLLKYPYYTTTKTINGVTFTDNGDGTITANGTATAMVNFTLIWKNYHLAKGTYTISGCPEGGNVNTGFYIVCGTDSIRFSTDVGNGGTFSIIDDTNDFTFSLRINSGVTVDNIVFRPQLELGTTPTAYESPITGRELTVNVSGKNLIPFPYHDGYSKTHNGITFTVNSDGSVTANGTATDVSYFYIAQHAKIVKNGVTYAISGSPEGSNVNTYRIFINERKSDGTSNGVFIADFNDNKSFTVTDSCNSINIAIQIRSGVTVDNIVFRPQLELGTVATEYETPVGNTTTITPDSNPYAVPNDIRQVDGLNNISVSAGEISVTGVRKNAAIKRIWDKLDELTTAIIVSGGETE